MALFGFVRPARFKLRAGKYVKREAIVAVTDGIEGEC